MSENLYNVLVEELENESKRLNEEHEAASKKFRELKFGTLESQAAIRELSKITGEKLELLNVRSILLKHMGEFYR